MKLFVDSRLKSRFGGNLDVQMEARRFRDALRSNVDEQLEIRSHV